MVFMVNQCCGIAAAFAQRCESEFQLRQRPPPGRMDERVVLLRIGRFSGLFHAVIAKTIACQIVTSGLIAVVYGFRGHLKSPPGDHAGNHRAKTHGYGVRIARF